MYENYPLVQYGENVRIYFLLTLGYHIFNTFDQLLLLERRNDFIEMMLHHGLTLVLYTGSYLINCVEIGVLVVYAHDWADVFVHFAKACEGTHFVYIHIFNGVAIWISWFVSRIITFPLAVFYGVTVVPY